MQQFQDLGNPPPHTPGDTDPPTRDEMRSFVAQLKDLTDDNGLLVRLLLNVRQSNEFMRDNQRLLRVIAVGLLLCTVGIGTTVITLFVVSGRLSEVRDVVATSKVNIQDVQKQTEKTDKAVAEVKEQTQEPATKVELVPEMDPKKAKRAPIKVRITPKPPVSASAGASAAPAPSAVEVPLPSPIQAQPVPAAP